MCSPGSWNLRLNTALLDLFWVQGKTYENTGKVANEDTATCRQQQCDVTSTCSSNLENQVNIMHWLKKSSGMAAKTNASCSKGYYNSRRMLRVGRAQYPSFRIRGPKWAADAEEEVWNVHKMKSFCYESRTCKGLGLEDAN